MQGYTEERGREFQRRLLDKVRSTPGIEATGLTDGLPLTMHSFNNTIYLEGKPEPRLGDATLANIYTITPGYLRAMQTLLLTGRDFDARDNKDAPLVALVNETFVRQLLSGEDPIGTTFDYWWREHAMKPRKQERRPPSLVAVQGRRGSGRELYGQSGERTAH